MAFVRRFTFFPGIEVLDDVESVVIVDLAGPASVTAIGNRVACIAGEFLKGPVNAPTRVSSTQDLLAQFGSWSSVIPHASEANRANGNGFLSLARKKFTDLILVRADMRAASAAGGAAAPGTGAVTLTFGGTPTPTAQDFTLPAGFRLSDAAAGAATRIVCLADDVLVPAGTTLPFVVSNVRVFFNTGVEATVAGATTIDTAFDAITSFGFPSTMTLTVASGDLYQPYNAVTATALDTAYQNAINSALSPEEPAVDINVIWAARTSVAIQTALRSNAVDASAIGRGRMAILRAASGTAKPTTNAAAEAAFGAGNRNARAVWVYPHVRFNPQLLDTITAAATTATTFPAVGLDGFMASVLSLLPPERNPGEGGQNVLQSILGFETPLLGGSPFVFEDYRNFRTFGMAVIRSDPGFGWEFHSGVTSVNPTTEPTRTEIKRQRMADFINDNLASIAARYVKSLATRERREALLGEYFRFLDDLRSRNNQAAQRIEDFNLDSASGNTTALNNAGIFVDIINVRLLQDQRVLVIQSTIGETVEIAAAA